MSPFRHRGSTFVDDLGVELVYVHGDSECNGAHCVIHNPSDHPMRGFPLVWREAGPLDVRPSHFERICPHGIGHPDPDGLEFARDLRGREEADRDWLVHGCDSCCAGSYD